MVIIVRDGIRYLNPEDVSIPKKETTENFFRIVENYVPDKGEERIEKRNDKR